MHEQQNPNTSSEQERTKETESKGTRVYPLLPLFPSVQPNFISLTVRVSSTVQDRPPTREDASHVDAENNFDWSAFVPSSDTVQPLSSVDRLRTYLALGLPNLWRVFVYRLKKKYGYFARTMPIGESYEGPFFTEKSSVVSSQSTENDPGKLSTEDSQMKTSYSLFSHIEVQTDGPPDWFVNPLNGERIEAVVDNWSKTEDFSETLGDIKCVWEASRFDWLPQRAWEWKKLETRNERLEESNRQPSVVSRQQNDSPATNCQLTTDDCQLLETWVSDWVEHNPLNRGPNWRCGQEVSIRAMNMLLTGKILGILDDPPNAFVRFLAEHASRIPPTISYAVGQDTNHATSEAVALFLIGHYVERVGDSRYQKCGENWRDLGRYWLEERVRHLIEPDGTFAQYSVNYHRLMLSTLALVESFRREWGLPAFSAVFYERATAATHWLDSFVDPVSGDAPNLGPNDGAYLFNLDQQPYRDFRPILKFAKQVFLNAPCDGISVLANLFPFSDRLRSDRTPSTTTQSRDYFPDGGFVRLAPSKDCWGLVRFANFKKRPKESDVLHLDLWRNGVNVLRDGGSYCYADKEAARYFSGTSSHNTADFGHDQMRRVGRFLFGDWIRMSEVSRPLKKGHQITWSASYADYAGSTHKRTVTASDLEWIVKDTIRGFRHHAVIRWRLAPANWQIDGNLVRSDLAKIVFEPSRQTELRLLSGKESLHYLSCSDIPVVELTVRQPGSYRTRITWS